MSISIDDKENRLFYIKNRPLVYRCCLFVLGNEKDAQDITNTVFAMLLELKSKGRLDICYPKTFLSKIAKNMSISKRKKDRSEFLEICKMAYDEKFNWFIDKGDNGWKMWEAGLVDKGYEQIEAEIIIKAILEEQDETTRKIYFYKYLEDMTLEQTCEMLGLVKSAVHKRLKKLEKQIKAAWGKGGK
jgi:RNA polymerase sigma factor (sigma-70 family)